MRDSLTLSNLLMAGTLRADSFPELFDEDILDDVSKRLAQSGFELVRAGDTYIARNTLNPESPDGFEPIFELNEAELAVAAALYLHLRYLPRPGRVEGAGRRGDSVSAEEIEHAFPGYTQKWIGIVLGRLKNAGFVRRIDERYYAGPYLYAFDEIEADERATAALRDFRLRRYFRQVAKELDPEAGPSSNGASSNGAGREAECEEDDGAV